MKIKLKDVYLIKTGNFRLFVKNNGAYYLPAVKEDGSVALQKVPGNFLDNYYAESFWGRSISLSQLAVAQMALDGKIEKDSPILTKQSREIVEVVSIYKEILQAEENSDLLTKEIF